MRGRFFMSIWLVATLVAAVPGHARDEPAAEKSIALTVESAAKGKLRVTQMVKGQKPVVLDIEARDEHFELGFGDNTRINARNLRIEFLNGKLDGVSASGNVRMNAKDLQFNGEDFHSIVVFPTEDSLSLTVEGKPDGEVCITETIKGRKPMVLVIQWLEGRNDIKIGDDLMIGSKTFSIYLVDGQPKWLKATGNIRAKFGKSEFSTTNGFEMQFEAKDKKTVK